MPNIWFTADLHLGHTSIIQSCERPFESIEEHDHYLVDAWNSVVGPKDLVYVIGDFAYKAEESHVRRCFNRMRGSKILVLGNHDGRFVREQLQWSAVHERCAVSVDGQRLVLDHYAGRCWDGSHRGVVQLFGHSHGRLADTYNSCDVGVDCWDYRPVSWPEVKARIDLIPRPAIEAELEEAEYSISGHTI